MNFMLGVVLAAALAIGAKDPTKAEWDPRDDGPDKVDVSSWPPAMQKRYPVFLVKCAKCHPVARPINSRFDAADWKRYMKKMIRRPNSGINEEQAADIYEFLKYYSTRQGAK
jgi:hypothetical protein